MQKQQAERVALKNNSASCIIDFSSQTITSHKAPVLHGSSSLVRIATVKDLKQIMLGTVRKQIQQTPRNQKPRCIIILQDTKRKQTK